MQHLGRQAHLTGWVGGQVLHLAGRLTDEVVGFLGPATSALAESGVGQTLLAQEPRDEHLLRRIDPSVELVLVPAQFAVTRRWAHTWSTVRRLAARHRALRAVHLHGFVPGLIAPFALRQLARSVPLVYSPHSSKAIGSLSLLGRPLWWMTRPVLSTGLAGGQAIASTSADVGAWRSLSSHEVAVAESPIEDGFFELERAESPERLVVVGGTMLANEMADMLAQLQVLLGDDEVGLRFVWAGGPLSASARERLKAANIAVVPAADAQARMDCLAQAWAFVAPPSGLGFPAHLAEAMAAGLPCVAVSTPYHLSLIRHGDTGLVGNSVAELAACLLDLVERVERRQALGANARREAMSRFTVAQFRDSFFSAYEQSVAPTSGPRVMAGARLELK